MKLYIHTDLEGISGVDTIEMMDRNGPLYRDAVGLLMADINAAVEGAFAGGAEHVTVLDSHGGGGNFDLSQLDGRAEVDTRENNEWWGKLDETYDGTIFIGAHAMAGTINGFLDHTQSSRTWFDYRVNGRSFGELAQWAMIAGHFDVPLLMVSGDLAACVEAKQFFHPLHCAVVKEARGRNKAELIAPEQARATIAEEVKAAVAIADRAKPFKPLLPLELQLTLNRSDFCDALAERPGVERLDARTLRKVTQTTLDWSF